MVGNRDGKTGADLRAEDRSWEEMAKNILRAEMVRNGASYATLVERLAAFGIVDNELNLRNKISRGRFTAVFFLQCLKALNAEWIQVPSALDGTHPDLNERRFLGTRSKTKS